MSLAMCVQLWAVAGKGAELVAYEDLVLALLPDHGGRLVVRARAADADQVAAAYETQVIEFASEDGLTSYLADERRVSLASMRDAAIARTDIQYVNLV
jgi:uncharacterized protein (DUF1330 family)